MTKKIAQNLLLVPGSMLLGLLAFEVLTRLFISPSEQAYSMLLELLQRRHGLRSNARFECSAASTAGRWL
jgi:hypothetical protein